LSKKVLSYSNLSLKEKVRRRNTREKNVENMEGITTSPGNENMKYNLKHTIQLLKFLVN
jgi:hypothetical protein